MKRQEPKIAAALAAQKKKLIADLFQEGAGVELLAVGTGSTIYEVEEAIREDFRKINRKGDGHEAG